MGSLAFRRRFWNLPQVLLQKLLQCHRIVVLGIVRAVNQGYRPMANSLEDRLPSIGISLKFVKVAAPKFIPFRWIVTELFP